MGDGAISQTLKPSYLEDMKHDLFPGEKPTHAQPTDLSPKNAAHKDAMPGRSSDAGARHSELLHHLEKHTASKTMKTFHQSYSAGPPPSPFWNVLKGAKTKMSDLRPDPQELTNRPLLSVVMILKSDSDNWIPHVHLTCICFWVIVNYLYVSLPIIMPFMTVLPVVLILVLRLYEKGRRLKQICIESTLFLIAIVLHICLDIGQISAEHFYQMLAFTVALIILVSKEFKPILILFFLPLF